MSILSNNLETFFDKARHLIWIAIFSEQCTAGLRATKTYHQWTIKGPDNPTHVNNVFGHPTVEGANETEQGRIHNKE